MSARRFFSAVAAFAILLAFFGMPSGMAVAALDNGIANGSHCPGEVPEGHAPEGTNGIDCMIACSAVPSDPHRLREQIAVSAETPFGAVVGGRTGLLPGSELPPPKHG